MRDIAFEALADPPRLRVADTVGNEQYTLYLESPVEPEPASTDGFTYPVSDAVRVEVSGFALRGHVRMHIWDGSGELVQVVDDESVSEVPRGEYSIELCRMLKTYLKVTAAMRAEVDSGGVEVRFESPVPVEIGVRSPRNRPANCITTTEDPGDIMRALSHLGAGLLTTTPMRAYPNLRGYPPDVRLGDELDVPDEIETGRQPVAVAVPPRLDYLYEAAPLVYYLNADVRAGSTPELLVDGTPIHELDAGSFADEVAALLGHVFVLDCAVRTAGPYPLETVEVDRIAEIVPHDLDTLYRADQERRLRSYLEVPFGPVAELLHEWPVTATVEPVEENVEAIPHLVSRLVPIGADSPPRLSGTDARRAALERFTETAAPTRAATDVFDGRGSFVDTGGGGTTCDLWVGPDIPLSANDFVLEGYRNRFSRPRTEQRSIDVTIVCNESWMSDEAVSVRRQYDAREDLPFDVSVHENLDRDSLAELLATETDFLHYVGHATTEGLECTDGFLDVATVRSIGVETFLLNACQSYTQAREMIEGGAVGGIATLSDVTDAQAAIVGRTAARLLNLGYPLRTALSIARSRSVVGGQYLTVGDDSVMLVAADHVPTLTSVTTRPDGYEVSIATFHSKWGGAGGLFVPWMESEDEGYLVGKTAGPYEMSAAELESYLEFENLPVQFDGEFRWADDLADDLA